MASLKATWCSPTVQPSESAVCYFNSIFIQAKMVLHHLQFTGGAWALCSVRRLEEAEPGDTIPQIIANVVCTQTITSL